MYTLVAKNVLYISNRFDIHLDFYIQTGFTNIETTRDGEYLYCRWTQPYVHSFEKIDFSTTPQTVEKSTFDLKNAEWYLQLAYGDVKAGESYMDCCKSLINGLL